VRSPSRVRGSEEREQTLNQLLTEMDGFSTRSGVVFIAATNRADLLDPALLRPGRFDRKVRVLRPDYSARVEILKINSSDKDISEEVSFAKLANSLAGMGGADISFVVSEALRLSSNRRMTTICETDFIEAIDVLKTGQERTELPMDSVTRERVAVYEVSKAVVSQLLYKQNGELRAIERVSITPRGNSLSRIHYSPSPTSQVKALTRRFLSDKLLVYFAGRAGEILMLGNSSTLGHGDLISGTDVASRLVSLYSSGLDEGAPAVSRAYGRMRSINNPERLGSYYSKTNTTLVKTKSATEAQDIYIGVQHLCTSALNETFNILATNQELLKNNVEILLQKGECSIEELSLPSLI